MSPINLLNIVILCLCCQNKSLGKIVSFFFARKDLLSNTTTTNLAIFSQFGCGSRLECSVMCSQNKECVSFFYNTANGQCTGHAVQIYSTDPGSEDEGSVYYTRLHEGSTCPLGFTGFKSSCYLFSHITANYDEAESCCRGNDSRLAEVDSKDEDDFLKGHLEQKGGGFTYFISGTDLRVEGIWTWENPARRISYLNWHPGQPDNYKGSENCLEYLERSGYLMNDGSCKKANRFVCEKNL